jgi:hypothetical protein
MICRLSEDPFLSRYTAGELQDGRSDLGPGKSIAVAVLLSRGRPSQQFQEA